MGRLRTPRRRPPALSAITLMALAVLFALVPDGHRLAWRDVPLPVTAPVVPAGLGQQLYLARYRDGGLEFLAIDPQTLADLPARPVLRIPDLDYGHFTMIVSADGSTIAVMQYSGALAQAEDVTIRIVDAQTGRERTRLRTPVPVEMHYLAADGSRLFAWGPAYRPEPQRRFVWDTADGRLLATVPLFGSAYDTSGHRAYGLAGFDPGNDRRRDATLVVQEVMSGQEVGRVRLADALAGRERGAMVQPSIAVSPDGRCVAVLHADGDTLTLVNAENQRVLWTRALTRAPGVPDRTEPQPPEGKRLRQTNRSLHFSPDGRYLFTSGSEEWMVDAGRLSFRLLGLRTVEIERAEIVAHAGGERHLEWFTVAPGGDALYTLDRGRDTPSYKDANRLRHLDPLTLAVMAEREFPGARSPRLVHLIDPQP